MNNYQPQKQKNANNQGNNQKQALSFNPPQL